MNGERMIRMGHSELNNSFPMAFIKKVDESTVKTITVTKVI